MPDFVTRATRPVAASEPAVPVAARLLAAVRRWLEILIAFATLRDAEAVGDRPFEGIAGRTARSSGGARRLAAAPPTVPPSHPHRRPLRATSRARRPGAVPPDPQPCITPLAATRRARRPERVTGPRH